MSERRTCANPGCGGPIVRRPGEKPSVHATRKTCSEPCRRKLVKAARNERDAGRPDPEHPPCVVCGKPVVRRKTEGLAVFIERECCSRECGLFLGQSRGASTMAAKGYAPPKPCVVCGEMMERTYHESRARFAQRKCCSRACMGKLATLKAGGDITMPRALKLPDAPKVMGRPTTALNRCTSCGETIPKPDGMTWAKYRGRSTCGSDECKHATSRKAVSAPKEREMSPLRAALHIARPSVAQLRAYREATPDERRLFSRHIAAVAEAGMGR